MSQYNRKDKLYHQAKSDGLKSRAAYKLVELNERFGFLKSGGSVLDLGAAPGGWAQIASNKVGDSGVVVAIDLEKMEPIGKNVNLVVGDARDEIVVNQIKEIYGLFDVVLSDMSPKLTGIREVDEARCSSIAEIGLEVAETFLKSGGFFAVKVFKNSESKNTFNMIKQKFQKTVRCELDSTRKTSNEFYVVGIGYKG